MKLNFMTWVIFNTKYNVLDIDQYYFAIEEIRNPRDRMSKVWFCKEGNSILDETKEGCISVQDVMDMAEVRPHWLPIKDMFLKYKVANEF